MAKKPSLYTDLEIVTGLLHLDPVITSYVLYERCYPLFKHLFSSYYTDCKTCIDLAHEIYVLIMVPGPKSHRSKLQSFEFRSSFDTWISVVSHNYCYAKFKKRIDISTDIEDIKNKAGDSFSPSGSSLELDIRSISTSDLDTVIGLMPNLRYQNIIRLIYLEGKDYDETAQSLGMSKSNLYNKHILAKEQFVKILKKEGLL